MKFLKYGWMITICVIILVLVYHHLIKLTPEDKVKSVLMNIEKTEDLSEVEKRKIRKLIHQSENYGFPTLKLTDKVEVFLRPQLQQITLYKSDLYLGEMNVFVSYEIQEYEQKEDVNNGNFIHVGNYHGRARFVLKDIGFNKWEITQVETTQFKPVSKNGHWSGSYE